MKKHANANIEGALNGAEDEHELIRGINESTKFFLLKIPNQDCFMYSLSQMQIALTENCSQAFEKIFQQHKEGDSLILFVTIQGSEQLYGVCKVPQANLIEEVNEDWKQYWQGKFKSAITVEWSIPDCAMPLSKIN